MELLGLVENITAEYNDGYTHYQVSALCAQVLLYALLVLLPLLVLLGFLLRWITVRAGRPAVGIWLVRGGVALLLVYALLLAAGTGPYLQLYPCGGASSPWTLWIICCRVAAVPFWPWHSIWAGGWAAPEEGHGVAGQGDPPRPLILRPQNDPKRRNRWTRTN